MNSLKISIIIPVYNSASYLKICLDSVIYQTFIDFECICIDDGSDDDSLAILKKYEINDKRFIAITQKHQGVSAARNHGLKIATGKYIVFIDSDDWVTKDYLEVLYNNIEKYNCDMISSFSYFYNNQTKKTYFKKTQKEFLNHVITSFETKKKLLALWNMWACWGKIYNKKFITKNNIIFKDCQMEDILFAYETIIKSSSLMLIRDILYYYRKNIEGSLSFNNNRIYSFISLDR